MVCLVETNNPYVWEEQVSVLGIESFYLGKTIILHPLTLHFMGSNFTYFSCFPAFGILGVGIAASGIVLMLENLFHKKIQ